MVRAADLARLDRPAKTSRLPSPQFPILGSCLLGGLWLMFKVRLLHAGRLPPGLRADARGLRCRRSQYVDRIWMCVGPWIPSPVDVERSS